MTLNYDLETYQRSPTYFSFKAIAGFQVIPGRPCWWSRTNVFLSSGNLTVFLCKFFEKIFYCIDPQHGWLVTWLQTKNTNLKVAKWQKDIAYLRVLRINIVELNIICCEPLKNHILEEKDTVSHVSGCFNITVDTFLNKCYSLPSTLLDVSCFR